MNECEEKDQVVFSIVIVQNIITYLSNICSVVAQPTTPCQNQCYIWKQVVKIYHIPTYHIVEYVSFQA